MAEQITLPPSSPSKLQLYIKSNPNTLYGMNQYVLRVLANGNCQFIIDISRQLEIGYSGPVLALYISHIFFSKMCYINYDRFLYLTASFIIALKIKDICIPIKKICNAFYSVIIKLNKSFEPYSEKKYELIRDELCKAEALLFRVLEFNMDYKIPLEYVDKYCKLLVPDKKCNKVFFTCRVLIIDSYRTFACNMWNPLVVFFACFMIACKYEKIVIVDSEFVRCMMLDITKEAVSDEVKFEKLLEWVSNEDSMLVTAEDVRDCIVELNKLGKILEAEEEEKKKHGENQEQKQGGEQQK